jgi:hypothetical protein
LPGFVCADIDGAFLDAPDPVGEGAVEEGVDSDGEEGVVFCGFEA